MPVIKKHIAIILIVLMTLMMICIVVWLFHKRIERIERKMKPVETMIRIPAKALTGINLIQIPMKLSINSYRRCRKTVIEKWETLPVKWPN